jgi:hypothetical protein
MPFPMRTPIRRKIIVAIVAGGLCALAAPAFAQREPLIVVPPRPGVPVMMYGIDISGGIVEGEFGLDRPGQVAPTVILPYWPRPFVWAPIRPFYPGAGRWRLSTYEYTPYEHAPYNRNPFYPATGHRPRSGRLEVIPPANRKMPKPAEPYYREWTIEPTPGPASGQIPFEPPPPAVVVTPPVARPKGPAPNPAPLDD